VRCFPVGASLVPRSSPSLLHFQRTSSSVHKLEKGKAGNKLDMLPGTYWFVLPLQPVSPEELGVSGVKGRPQVVDHTHT